MISRATHKRPHLVLSITTQYKLVILQFYKNKVTQVDTWLKGVTEVAAPLTGGTRCLPPRTVVCRSIFAKLPWLLAVCIVKWVCLWDGRYTLGGRSRTDSCQLVILPPLRASMYSRLGRYLLILYIET